MSKLQVSKSNHSHHSKLSLPRPKSAIVFGITTAPLAPTILSPSSSVLLPNPISSLTQLATSNELNLHKKIIFKKKNNNNNNISKWVIIQIPTSNPIRQRLVQDLSWNYKSQKKFVLCRVVL